MALAGSTPAPADKEMRRYQAQDAAHVLARAEEIKGDPRLMGDVKEHVARLSDAVSNSVKGTADNGKTKGKVTDNSAKGTATDGKGKKGGPEPVKGTADGKAVTKKGTVTAAPSKGTAGKTVGPKRKR